MTFVHVVYSARYHIDIGPHVFSTLTKEGLRLRDRAVISAVARAGVPLVVVMAGGYARRLGRLAGIEAAGRQFPQASLDAVAVLADQNDTPVILDGNQHDTGDVTHGRDFVLGSVREAGVLDFNREDPSSVDNRHRVRLADQVRAGTLSLGPVLCRQSASCSPPSKSRCV